MISKLFTPFAKVDVSSFLIISQVLALLAFWVISPGNIIPTPLEIASAWNTMAKQGMLIELGNSGGTIVKAMLLSTGISLLIACLSTLPFFKSATRWLTTLRFLGFAGITFLFTLWTSNGSELKLWLLIFGMTVFLTTNLLATVDTVTQQEIDYARTLGLNPWHAAFEVVVLGKLSDILDLVRQNMAIGWTMLSMVEGLVRSEGGVGALLLVQNRHFHIDAVFAIQLTILAYGLFQDFMLKMFRELVCPYVKLTQVKS